MNPLKIEIQILITVILFCTSGCKKVEPEVIPVINTNDIEIYSEGIYNLKGTVISIGKEKIIEHGFCWSESINPETGGNIVRLGPKSSAGSFSSFIYDIQPGKTYYVKAYVISNLSTYYGDNKSFRTPDNIVYPIIDIDHNIYYPVKIGDQIWMNDNLKVTHYPDATPIQRIDDRLVWFYMPWYNPAYCWYENYGAIAADYGNLYTWPAAMHINSKDEIKTGEVQGICPDGWHLPSDDEWKKLEIFLGMSLEEADGENWRGQGEGGKMKYRNMWKSPNTGATNESHFGSIPAGWRDGAGYYRNIEASTRFWSSSIRGDYPWVRQLNNNSSQIFRGTIGVYEGVSVRCIKNSAKQ